MEKASLPPLTTEELKKLIMSYPNGKGKASDALGMSHDMLKVLDERNLGKIVEMPNMVTPLHMNRKVKVDEQDQFQCRGSIWPLYFLSWVVDKT